MRRATDDRGRATSVSALLDPDLAALVATWGSSIVADGGLLFTMYRSGEDEVVVALRAETGATEWEHKVRTTGVGDPANSTPLVEGNRLYTLGFSGILSALDKSSGKLAWSHDLVEEYKAKWPQYGFAASPLAHEGSVILPVGGAGFGVAAFALADGKLLWHAHDLEEIYASPILIVVEGEVQVVVLAAQRIVGLDCSGASPSRGNRTSPHRCGVRTGCSA